LISVPMLSMLSHPLNPAWLVLWARESVKTNGWLGTGSVKKLDCCKTCKGICSWPSSFISSGSQEFILTSWYNLPLRHDTPKKPGGSSPKKQRQSFRKAISIKLVKNTCQEPQPMKLQSCLGKHAWDCLAIPTEDRPKGHWKTKCKIQESTKIGKSTFPKSAMDQW
jgi:hypothetical protein